VQKKILAGLLIDLIILFTSFLVCIWIKPGDGTIFYFKSYATEFIVFVLIWFIFSGFFGKYNIAGKQEQPRFIKSIIFCNIIIFLFISSIIYLFQAFYFSRFIVLGTIGVASFAELISGYFYFMFDKTVIVKENGNLMPIVNSISAMQKLMVPSKHLRKANLKYDYNSRIEFLKKEIGENAFNFILPYAAIESPNTLVLGTTTRFSIDAQITPFFECIVNVRRVNDFRYINKFFESVNSRLPIGGIFIDLFESKDLRKKRILNKFPPIINYIYYALDFIVKRVFPKSFLTKRLYFMLTRGENRVLSKAEAFGRLYSCGFEVLNEKSIDGNMYFIAIKVKEPLFPKNPSYGPMVALERVGRKGKDIKVYKMRTMHPFAEYLQDYMYKRKGLQEGGKFKDDFRVTTLGKLMRKFWIDELPMLINFIRGELKIVGVRPLSKQYFNLYTVELQELRIKNRPGLIPPFYVDYPKTLDEIMESELRYLKAYEKHPCRTDWVYFWKSVINIIFNKYRSK